MIVKHWASPHPSPVLVGKLGRGTQRLIQSKERTYETTQPNATGSPNAFYEIPFDLVTSLRNLAKDIRVCLLCVECARVVTAGAVLELGRPIRVVQSPSSFRFGLIAQTSTVWLPWFVEGLEVEDIYIPAEQSAYAMLEEGVGFINTV